MAAVCALIFVEGLLFNPAGDHRQERRHNLVILIDATDRGFLNDTARDVLAIAGCILAIIPLLPSKKLAPPEPDPSSDNVAVAHPKRLALLPITVALALPVAVLGWIFRGDSLGETIFVFQYFLSFLYAIGVTISVSEILRRYGYSLRIFAILTCSLCALIAAIAAAASGFGGSTSDLPNLSFAAAVALAFFPVALGTPFALLIALIRLMWKSF